MPVQTTGLRKQTSAALRATLPQDFFSMAMHTSEPAEHSPYAKKIFGNGTLQQMCGRKKQTWQFHQDDREQLHLLLERKDIFLPVSITVFKKICGSMILQQIHGRRKQISEALVVTMQWHLS